MSLFVQVTLGTVYLNSLLLLINICVAEVEGLKMELRQTKNLMSSIKRGQSLCKDILLFQLS